jgi:hypothetical protein
MIGSTVIGVPRSLNSSTIFCAPPPKVVCVAWAKLPT